MTYLITLGYIVAAYLIFDRSTRQPTCLAQRLALASLGLALLSFATARFLLAYNIEQFWLFDMGHVSFFTFVALYFWNSRDNPSFLKEGSRPC